MNATAASSDFDALGYGDGYRRCARVAIFWSRVPPPQPPSARCFSLSSAPKSAMAAMTLVEGIVGKTLGGSMHIDSTPGVGTSVRVTVPGFAPDAPVTSVT